MPRAIQVGDRVAYSAAFLRSTGQTSSVDDVGGWRGTVTALRELTPGFTLAEIAWDSIGRSANAPKHGNDNGPCRVNVKNLARVGTPAMSAN